MEKENRLQRALKALYDFKTAPLHERADELKHLNRALDDFRTGTPISRSLAKDYLLNVYYRDYYIQQKKTENTGI